MKYEKKQKSKSKSILSKKAFSKKKSLGLSKSPEGVRSGLKLKKR